MLEYGHGRLLDLKTKAVIYSSAEWEYTESLCWYVERSVKAANDFDAEFDAAIRTILDNPQRFPFCDDRHQFYLMLSRTHRKSHFTGEIDSGRTKDCPEADDTCAICNANHAGFLVLEP